MVARVESQFDLTPERLIGDTAYGTAPMLAWMVEEKDIEPHVPVWDKTERKDDSLSSNDFLWNPEANEYRCPAGKPLRSEWRAFTQQRSRVTKANTIIYRSSQSDCATCPLKAKCCPNTTFRKIARASMKRPVTWREASPRHRNTSSLVANGRRWRCCSPTSNGS